jgi:hypothetical protein
MKVLNLFAAILLSLIIVGCGRIDSAPAPSVTAPTFISGKTIKSTITSGSGGFATTGTSDFVTSNTKNQYTINGDVVNVANSAGTFSYSSSGNQGIIAFDDPGFGKGNYNLTFTSTTSGTYTADVAQNSSANQTGTFIVQ